MSHFITAFFMVVVAEMGDKTQLLAMAMAARYRAGQVMWGVLIATIANHALAVLAGTYLGEYIPTDLVRGAAAISFLFFGLWTLRGDKLEDEDKTVSRFGPITTVVIAFFLAEMGDKTQLATIALAAEARSPLYVLVGTTLGMMVADGLGIAAGDFIAKRMPESAIKMGAAAIFILFGFYTLYETLGSSLPTYAILGGLAIVMVVVIYKMKWYRFRGGKPSRVA